MMSRFKCLRLPGEIVSNQEPRVTMRMPVERTISEGINVGERHARCISSASLQRKAPRRSTRHRMSWCFLSLLVAARDARRNAIDESVERHDVLRQHLRHCFEGGTRGQATRGQATRGHTAIGATNAHRQDGRA